MRSSTFRLLKIAVSDFVREKGLRFLSTCVFVLGVGLVYGANLYFHGRDHASPTEQVSRTAIEENSPNHPEGQNGARSLASVSGAMGTGQPSPARGELGNNSRSSDLPTNPSSEQNPNGLSRITTTTTTAQKGFWNNFEGVLSNIGAGKKADSANVAADGSGSGAGGAYNSASPLPQSSAAPAVPTKGSGSSESAGEFNGILHTSAPSAGFGIVSGGTYGSAVGMQIQASIGQITSPNIQNGTGVTLVSGLTGPLMINF